MGTDHAAPDGGNQTSEMLLRAQAAMLEMRHPCMPIGDCLPTQNQTPEGHWCGSRSTPTTHAVRLENLQLAQLKTPGLCTFRVQTLSPTPPGCAQIVSMTMPPLAPYRCTVKTAPMSSGKNTSQTCRACDSYCGRSRPAQSQTL